MTNKHFLTFLSAAAMFFIAIPSLAQKALESYNIERGMEAMSNGDYAEATEYFQAELDENPDNGYACTLLAVIHYESGELGQALSAANAAIKNLPRRDKNNRSLAYLYRAYIHEALEEYPDALTDYAAAIRLAPDESSFYDGRGDLYYKLEEYDLSDSDYRKMLELDSGDAMGYMGLGRNANAREDYATAEGYFTKVVNMASDYSSGYSFRAESYIGQGKYTEALDDIIAALEIDKDDKAYYMLMNEIPYTYLTQAVAKLGVKAAGNPEDVSWPIYIAILYQIHDRYAEAVDCLLETGNHSNLVTYLLAENYSQLGEYDLALEYVDEAIAQDSSDYDTGILKADILYGLGREYEAIDQLTATIALAPESYAGYHKRGFYKDNTGDVDGAIKDYTMAVSLEPADVYAYMLRGDMYLQKGDTLLARADYEKVIQLDTVPDVGSCAFYAYAALGEEDKAVEFLDGILSENPYDASIWYEAACLYSRMKDMDKALSCLEKALELGYREFNHISNDDDLDYIRGSVEFQSLIEKYDTGGSGPAPSEDALGEYVERTAEIPFTRDGGVYVVECKVNSLPLRFVFDTGASDVSISDVEATFMMKNGYLSSRDVRGSGNYITADGSVVQGTILNLRDIEFGGLHLRNVRASVVRSQRAPLLLGQSVLSRLGKIEIDSEHSVIRIKYMEKL